MTTLKTDRPFKSTPTRRRREGAASLGANAIRNSSFRTVATVNSPFFTMGHSKPLERNLERLQEFAAAERGWNGYDSLPFSKKIISATAHLLLNLGPLPQPFVSPLTDNGIQLDWQRGADELEVEVYESHLNYWSSWGQEDSAVSVEVILRILKQWHADRG